jgi:hypothetical protein
MSCPICGGRVVYQGFSFVDCTTTGCRNGPAEVELAGGETRGRYLMQFALALSPGQHWAEVSTSKLFELVAFHAGAVELESWYGPTAGQWIRRSISIVDLADPSKWQHVGSAGSVWPPLPSPWGGPVHPLRTP